MPRWIYLQGLIALCGICAGCKNNGPVFRDLAALPSDPLVGCVAAEVHEQRPNNFIATSQSRIEASHLGEAKTLSVSGL
jgi:hypothetical protein